MNNWPKVRFDAACPPDKAFLMPPDVVARMDLMIAAATMRDYGIISHEMYLGVCKEVTDAAVKAAKEGRIGVITNLGEATCSDK